MSDDTHTLAANAEQHRSRAAELRREAVDHYDHDKLIRRAEKIEEIASFLDGRRCPGDDQVDRELLHDELREVYGRER